MKVSLKRCSCGGRLQELDFNSTRYDPQMKKFKCRKCGGIIYFAPKLQLRKIGHGPKHQ